MYEYSVTMEVEVKNVEVTKKDLVRRILNDKYGPRGGSWQEGYRNSSNISRFWRGLVRIKDGLLSRRIENGKPGICIPYF